MPWGNAGRGRSDTTTAAVTYTVLTKVVARGLPFQFTTDPLTKPAPFTISVNPDPPGTVAEGTMGRSIKGTGLLAAKAGPHAIARKAAKRTGSLRRTPDRRSRPVRASNIRSPPRFSLRFSKPGPRGEVPFFWRRLGLRAAIIPPKYQFRQAHAWLAGNVK